MVPSNLHRHRRDIQGRTYNKSLDEGAPSIDNGEVWCWQIMEKPASRTAIQGIARVWNSILSLSKASKLASQTEIDDESTGRKV